MPIGNPRGIFQDKKAWMLAVKYHLSTTDKSAYIYNLNKKYITYNDVKFIVENLWLNHLMYNTNPPIDLPHEKYKKICSYIRKTNEIFF